MHTLLKSQSWQAERSVLLQSACGSIKRSISSGQAINKTIRRVARRYHGRTFKADPQRRLKLSAVTMRRAWDAWRRGGELPDAFRLKFTTRKPGLWAALLIRFAEFCAAGRHASMQAAWTAFARRGGQELPNISYGQVRYFFPVASFYQMQAQLKAADAARVELGRLKQGVVDALRSRLPARPPRARGKRGSDFQA